MSDLLNQLKNKTKTANRSELTDVYKAARDLEIQELASKVIQSAGRAASTEYLQEVALAIAEAASKRSAR